MEDKKNKANLTSIIFIWSAVIILFFYVTSYFNKHNTQERYIEENGKTVNKVIVPLNYDNHYVIKGSINSIAVDFIVDTGASYVAIPAKLADSMSLTRKQQINIATASGKKITGYMTVIPELKLHNIVLHNVKAVILVKEAEHAPALLGMSALRRLHLIQDNGVLTFTQR